VSLGPEDYGGASVLVLQCICTRIRLSCLCFRLLAMVDMCPGK
jgi:hypothetical protein